MTANSRITAQPDIELKNLTVIWFFTNT